MTRTRKPTATERFFADYPEYIIDCLFEHGCMPSYSTRKSMDNWYSVLPYSDDTMEIIMQKTVLFLRLLNGTDSNSTNPQVLYSLNAKIAKYLSAYKMRGNPRILSGQQLNEKSLHKIQAKAMAELKEQLDNCSYIKFLMAKQAANRAVKAAGRKYKQRAAKERRKKEARDNYETVCQVRVEFQIMQHVPRKSR